MFFPGYDYEDILLASLLSNLWNVIIISVCTEVPKVVAPLPEPFSKKGGDDFLPQIKGSNIKRDR